ncbi:PEP/pyruvate-binding domain-containing protein [Microlunatus ginsengisoli]|uniref:Pyruvate, water dikinase n=1 Tax=Microlunatus ginsengisoli TaxID=363863 RepID=A0ABP7AI20_9ACTN
MPRTRAPAVLALDEATPDLAELGGKAASLVRLANAGLPVPDGFVVTTRAYRDYLDHHGLRAQIERLIEDPDRIGRLFAEHPLPDELVAEIIEAYADLGEPPVAVRSSATAEDLPDASFAGQQETYLNVTAPLALLESVRRCWASLWTGRAIAYRDRQGIDAGQLGMAVVVQELIDAEAAGIMFTADPVSGDAGAIEIDSAWGLGEAVVGGEVTPDTFHVDAVSGRLRSSQVADKTVMTVRTRAGTQTKPVPVRRRHKPSLEPEQAERLAVLGGEIAALFDAPVDVEWARRGGDLFVLQARPITAGAGRDRRPDPWNDSRNGYFLWTNTNVGEAMPDVLTPASWSMVELFLHDVMATSSVPPYLSYGRVGGRIYLNLSVAATLAGAVGVSEKRFRQLTEEVFGRIPDDVPLPMVEAPRMTVISSVAPVALHVIRSAARDIRRFDRYLSGNPARCLEHRERIEATRDADALARLWSSTILPDFHNVSWMLSAATRSSGISFVTTRQRLQKLVGDADANAITAGLGAHSGELASLGLLDGLEQLAQGRIDRETFNTTYAHRGPHEFEIATPRPGEEPDWIDRQLAQLDPTLSYRDLIERQNAARDAAWERLTERHPLTARSVRRQLRIWATIARNREWARSEIIRYFWVLRAFALRAGELTGLGDDIFFCTSDQIVDALDGHPPDAGGLAAARAAYQAYLALPPYPTMILGRFDPFGWAADPLRRTDRYVEGGTAEIGDSDTVRGFPGSAGVVDGVVRVLGDASQAAAFRPGEVLVTTITNVGWTPLFPRAAAVITDVGAPLSHAAIVARELGIPAVVGCGDATMRLRTGDRVRVDGSAGTVTRLERSG